MLGSPPCRKGAEFNGSFQDLWGTRLPVQTIGSPDEALSSLEYHDSDQRDTWESQGVVALERFRGQTGNNSFLHTLESEPEIQVIGNNNQVHS